MDKPTRYDLPIPFGWYAVALSDELETSEVKPVEYFGREMVLFRTEGGEAKVLDAYCPHLGAHLGYGGSVVGGSIACPFHGWQFNGEGYCTSVPYAKQMPPRAKEKCINHFPCKEDNGAVWVWYHPNGDEPHWELDHVPEMNEDDFWKHKETRDWVINCHIQDTNENAVDKAHFVYVHTSENVPEGEVKIDGHRRVTELASRTQAYDELARLIEGEYTDTNFTSKSFGPGFTWQHFRGVTNSIMMGTVTPIDQESVHLRFVFKYPDLETDIAKLFNQGYIDNVCEQVEQDMVIWNRKQYVSNPILCDGDGPINQYRKWFSQFYANNNQEISKSE
jgi:phenylpropionate dioxygenase-like ring-hydroxylating dioxygenase large terminal subunit